jgi:hypothetical protein
VAEVEARHVEAKRKTILLHEQQLAEEALASVRRDKREASWGVAGGPQRVEQDEWADDDDGDEAAAAEEEEEEEGDGRRAARRPGRRGHRGGRR